MMATQLRIYPSIGIARVGNSSEFYLGPLAPGIFPQPPFRDAHGHLKRQAVQFRIYEFDIDNDGNETCIAEITNNITTQIHWAVHVANTKAAGSRRNQNYEQSLLTIDPGITNIQGVNQDSGPLTDYITFKNRSDGIIAAQTDVSLLQLLTDDKGRLMVLSGNGKSASPLHFGIHNFINNDGWYDDLGDGPVTAHVVRHDKQTVEALSAWVVLAPPAVAPSIQNVVTWYDQARSIDAHNFTPSQKALPVFFTRDIYPILKRTVMLRWASRSQKKGSGKGHGGDFLETKLFKQLRNNGPQAAPARRLVLDVLTLPKNARGIDMPNINNAPNINTVQQSNPTTFTDLQYYQLNKWSRGDFLCDWIGEPKPVSIDNIALVEQPTSLTRAALESAFEVSYLPDCELSDTTEATVIYSGPYRINTNLLPGSLTQHNALPWQADHLQGGVFWWPEELPVVVDDGNGHLVNYARGMSTFADMVRYWAELGIIVQKGNVFIETERGKIP